MNISPCRFSGWFTLMLAGCLLANSAWAQNSSPNPLRSATTGSGRSPALRQAVAQEETTSVKSQPSPIRPTGFELARERRSIMPRQQLPAETSIIADEIIDREVIEGGVIYEGDVIFDGHEGPVIGGGCGGKGCGGKGCVECFTIPCPTICFDNFEVFTGVHGFTGPANRGEQGSFGFHEGFNWAAPVPCAGGEVAAQIGVAGHHSNFSAASYTDSKRNQIFLTGGLFRRVDWGLQGGVVFDYLRDSWYTDYAVSQLRAEASWVFPCAHELGFWFTASSRPDTVVSTIDAAPVTETFEGTDLYAFFYRHRVSGLEGAEGRVYAGFTGDSDGLIGADIRIPISCDIALEAGFAYLIPEQASGRSGIGYIEESWNLSMGVVWYPGSRSTYGTDYFRPLFNVADNGSFMVGRR